LPVTKTAAPQSVHFWTRSAHERAADDDDTSFVPRIPHQH